MSMPPPPLRLVLLIIGIAGWWGGSEAIIGAIAGGIGFDYFFLPQWPFAVENLEDLTALGAFLLTAIRKT